MYAGRGVVLADFTKFVIFLCCRLSCPRQTLENEACLFGTGIAGPEAITAQEPAMEHERIELSWKQFEGKKKYLYWNSVEATRDFAGEGDKTPEDVQHRHEAMDAEAGG
jgi:hypothetical protein